MCCQKEWNKQGKLDVTCLVPKTVHRNPRTQCASYHSHTQQGGFGDAMLLAYGSVLIDAIHYKGCNVDAQQYYN